jgi:hypothetical protein
MLRFKNIALNKLNQWKIQMNHPALKGEVLIEQGYQNVKQKQTNSRTKLSGRRQFLPSLKTWVSLPNL